MVGDNKISKLANEVLDDGDDLVVRHSSRYIDSASSITGNMSVASRMKFSLLSPFYFHRSSFGSSAMNLSSREMNGNSRKNLRGSRKRTWKNHEDNNNTKNDPCEQQQQISVKRIKNKRRKKLLRRLKLIFLTLSFQKKKRKKIAKKLTTTTSTPAQHKNEPCRRSQMNKGAATMRTISLTVVDEDDETINDPTPDPRKQQEREQDLRLRFLGMHQGRQKLLLRQEAEVVGRPSAARAKWTRPSCSIANNNTITTNTTTTADDMSTIEEHGSGYSPSSPQVGQRKQRLRSGMRRNRRSGRSTRRNVANGQPMLLRQHGQVCRVSDTSKRHERTSSASTDGDMFSMRNVNILTPQESMFSVVSVLTCPMSDRSLQANPEQGGMYVTSSPVETDDSIVGGRPCYAGNDDDDDDEIVFQRQSVDYYNDPDMDPRETALVFDPEERRLSWSKPGAEGRLFTTLQEAVKEGKEEDVSDEGKCAN